MTKSDSPVTVVGVHEAKTNLSKLLRLVESGVEVQIMRGTSPVARIVGMPARGERQLGFDEGKLGIPDDFDETDDELVESFYR